MASHEAEFSHLHCPCMCVKMLWFGVARTLQFTVTELTMSCQSYQKVTEDKLICHYPRERWPGSEPFNKIMIWSTLKYLPNDNFFAFILNTCGTLTWKGQLKENYGWRYKQCFKFWTVATLNPSFSPLKFGHRIDACVSFFSFNDAHCENVYTKCIKYNCHLQ